MHNSFYCHDIAAAVGKFVELEYRAFWRDRALPLSSIGVAFDEHLHGMIGDLIDLCTEFGLGPYEPCRLIVSDIRHAGYDWQTCSAGYARIEAA